MLLFSMIKPLLSVFMLRQIAMSLGDLSTCFSCQFWKLATLNQAGIFAIVQAKQVSMEYSGEKIYISPLTKLLMLASYHLRDLLPI